MPSENPNEDAYATMQEAQAAGVADPVVSAEAVAEALAAASPVEQEDTAEDEANAIRAKLGVASVVAAGIVGGVAAGAIAETLEKPIDAVEINNRIVNLPEHKQAEAIAALSPEEISAVAKMALTDSEGSGQFGFDSTYAVLKNFKFTPELIAQPEVTQALKNLLSDGQHFYNIERILHIPDFPKELLADQGVRDGLKEGLKRFVSEKSERDVEYEKDLIGKVAGQMGLTGEELREVAEEIKGRNSYKPFVRIFGAKNLYPEVS